MSKSNFILLVEDNPDDEFLTMRALSKGMINNEIVVVRDGQEALDFLFYEGQYKNREKRQPNLVLLDLKLPKVDGIDVLRRIRQVNDTKLIPTVILTSSKQEQDMIDSYSFGANSFIVKPVDIAQFLYAVEQLNIYWLSVNEPI